MIEKYVSNETFNGWLRDHIKKDDILFSTVGQTGIVSLMDDNEDAAIAQNIVAFRTIGEFIPGYIYTVLSTPINRRKSKSITMGAVQPSIKVSQLVNVVYLVTLCKKEQLQISDFFALLDNLITLHQCEPKYKDRRDGNVE